VNTALRAVHDLLTPAPVSRWLAVADIGRRLDDRRGGIDRETIDRWVAQARIPTSASQWRLCMTLLGVVAASGRFDDTAAADVATALRLVGDSFLPIPSPPTWELVSTVPRTYAKAIRPVMRRTATVILERFERAEIDVVLAAPFIDEGGISFLTDAAVDAGTRGVDLHIITSEGSEPALAVLRGQWPRNAGSLSITVLRTPDSRLGSHAKVVISDRDHAYLGSANFTAAGLSRHLELGVELEGPQVAELARLMLAIAAHQPTESRRTAASASASHPT
jgi:phosphatidylserine/phosphatidylglycerophosphate/cardiolipin synthase-like enzyme